MCLYKGHTSDKTTLQKSFKLDQPFMNNVEKTSYCIFKSGRLSLQYFEYVNTLFGSLSSQNIENQQIMSAKHTVLMLRVHQNERKKAFGRLPSYQEQYARQICLVALALLLIAKRFEQTGISIDVQD